VLKLVYKWCYIHTQCLLVEQFLIEKKHTVVSRKLTKEDKWQVLGMSSKTGLSNRTGEDPCKLL
jgi:hypothetical protein